MSIEKIIVYIFSIWCLIKNIYYANYEKKENKNIIAFYSIITINILVFVFFNIALFWY